MTQSNSIARGAEAANPYATPRSVLEDVTPAQLASRALFLPAIFLYVASALSAFNQVAMIATGLSPSGWFSGDGFEITRTIALASYFLILLVSFVCLAGAIAMLRMRAKWLAWTAAILALAPIFGPCLGLTIPLGIWAIVILRRPEVDASFRS